MGDEGLGVCIRFVIRVVKKMHIFGISPALLSFFFIARRIVRHDFETFRVRHFFTEQVIGQRGVELCWPNSAP